MIFNPYALLGLIAITFATGYHSGYKHANDHAEALKLQAVAKAQKQAEIQAKNDQQIAQNFETAREIVRTVYIKIKEKAHANIEKHPDYAGCSLDSDGLRLYNHNPHDPKGTAPGADGGVSGFASGTGWPLVDDPAQQPGTRGAVLRLSGAAQSIVGMGSINATVGADSIRPKTK